ncbi:beta-ketoacyl-[acyl-carrier-protein] synthase family protein [uncultured Vibrio sp.]|uniref:beta-ketoacyl-[acyl-carrier-protein] synthase family protein n=1 Tax=uncultured Vibrio sp. TaxID=114054 RepID=UPI0025EE5F76|nr:beta-ketoacyl-[acyl-carrier-protein] synthase family protein [uncultured Vibrio sp.]
MPTIIRDCGFISAMGSTDQEIKLSIMDSRHANMLQDTSTLNTQTETVVGRVATPLADIPVQFKRYQSRNNQLALSALLKIETTVQSAIAQFGSNRIAVVIGTSTSGISDGESAYKQHLDSNQFPSDFDYTKQELGNTSEFIAQYLGTTGPCYSISTACSSSGRVFITAKRMLNAGLVDAVIVGGVDTLCQLTLNGFNGLEALSTSLCQPFSANRNGINIGESAALMLLSHQAIENQLTPENKHIALLGAGDSSDAHHISAPHPDGHGAIKAMQNALDDAGLEANDIGYINAHGTATPLNDSMESKAIHHVFGENTLVSSTKPLTGHTLGAASATEAAIAWYILNYDLPLPKQGCNDKASDIDIRLVEEECKLDKKAILSNSFAFGGNNISLIFGYTDE